MAVKQATNVQPENTKCSGQNKYIYIYSSNKSHTFDDFKYRRKKEM